MTTQSPRDAKVKGTETMDADLAKRVVATTLLYSLGNPVMVADGDYNILYCNEAAFKMFERIEDDVRRDLPHFRARDIVGKNVDVFHKNPSYQRRIMDNMHKPHEGAFSIGGISLEFMATPVPGIERSSQFVLVEWRDVTEVKRIKAENEATFGQFSRLLSEMEAMASGHDKGDIDAFIDTSVFESEEVTKAASMINNMVRAHIDTKKLAMGVIEQFGMGNFDAPFPQMPGKKAFLNESLETARRRFIDMDRVNQLAKRQFEQLLEQMNHMARNHEQGDIDVYIDVSLFEDADIRNAANMANEMVKAHIDTKKAALAVVEEFGEGNFDAPFDTLPGKKIFINRILEKVRGNFREVVSEIRGLSDSIVAGNLDVQADLSKFKGEYRSVIESFEQAFGSLNSAFAVIAEQVDQVATTVNQVAHSSQTLSTNSQVASASVEEVSASVNQTDQQVRANADATQKASQFVTSAVGLADNGAAKIKDMVTAMHGIKTSSQDIAKIIKVIDEIAFQTNLLALNAAVEAARAGQHGRGFAVVAQEVRNLAGRSAKAARETSDLIEDASNRVNAGVRIADETSEAFTGISQQITQVKDIVEEIDRSGAEQSRGVAQISLAMSEIAKSALDTSQQADELAAGAAEMSAATEQMKDEIGRFKLRRAATAMPITGLSGLTPEMMAQIQAMLNGKPNDKAMRNGNGSGSLDLDARGFHGF
uniref:methyl-accepting chemotaxis protein n=1 Tax=Roseovarius sp. BRH_c41 TaxID=1629709 RepID=UPI0025F93E13|nr:methyl-accepting chemotaxis protein [Roseovarius sp. BRH_c41]